MFIFFSNHFSQYLFDRKSYVRISKLNWRRNCHRRAHNCKQWLPITHPIHVFILCLPYIDELRTCRHDFTGHFFYLNLVFMLYLLYIDEIRCCRHEFSVVFEKPWLHRSNEHCPTYVQRTCRCNLLLCALTQISDNFSLNFSRPPLFQMTYKTSIDKWNARPNKQITLCNRFTISTLLSNSPSRLTPFSIPFKQTFHNWTNKIQSHKPLRQRGRFVSFSCL